MIKLELDEREAWVLTQMLDLCLSGQNDDFFYTTEEDADGNYVETFDDELKTETYELYTKLLNVRGVQI